MGHRWRYTQMRGSVCMVCIPRVHFLEQPSAVVPFSPRLCSHVYVFVPHYSASASTDPHLAFKFPDQQRSHALMTRLLLQLNSLCSFYSDSTTDSLPSRLGRLLFDTMLVYSRHTESGIQGYPHRVLTWCTRSIYLCIYLIDEECRSKWFISFDIVKFKDSIWWHLKMKI